jgi:hypothetical protein
MNKKVFSIITILTVITLAAINVTLNSQKNELLGIHLVNTEEASANEFTDWWNSKVYKCELDICTKTQGDYTYYGSYSNCKSGDSYAHCWDCETSCDAN